MQCLEFRRAVGAEPGRATPEVLAHVQVCSACAEYRRQMLALDGRVRRALEVPVPAASTPGPVTRPRRTAWLALAASLLLAAGIGLGLWSSFPAETLAEAVVEHIEHEPGAMVPTHDRIAPFALDELLAHEGIRLRNDLDGVSYAKTCPFRGHTVPHLVVQTVEGPVTVLVLAHEQVAKEVAFHEVDGLMGTIVPAGPGSIAIVGGHTGSVDQVREQVLAAVEFLGAG